MPRSLAFQKIRSDVLGATAAIPRGRVSTYAAIGDHLEVMARHVSYILAQLTEEERAQVPWHRVVAKDGSLSDRNAARRKEQQALLEAEGHRIVGGKVAAFADKLFAFPQSGLKSRRGPYADPATPLLYPEQGPGASSRPG
jgi:methylated-DNA-protein-cysteine methyltransferase-like protein